MIVNSPSSSLTFDYINNSVATAVQAKESSLQTRISGMGQNPTTTDLLLLQQEVQQWTMMTQIQSTLVKEVSDAMKGVIQKAG
ncbi:MAG TPA: EscF/YscF/HrpA family type III secretion system needle major subunit [Ramlibacter sp.]|jgi:type III secretion protein F|uniref:EscF/YscF/HrpA family type III secretion system needle major subunit n=1 Tax=Ramlibacter sp. TaxID=1917967 RepID=UPI002D54D539|nr:EscF/YscF/HrpA family type III secretion system needle major subunit [Ramlibacter sp.]HZY20494.1 EscF/YscF/HrpA family type III secretion system needle major subunit [Ramlibacter sp.]